MEDLIKIMMMECALDYDDTDHSKYKVSDIANVVFERHREQLIIDGVVSSAKAQTTDDDEGWIYCPNCGRVKEDS